MKDNKIRIKIAVNKVPIGHQPHQTGTGVHQDKRTQRQRTRAAQRRLAIREWSDTR